MSETEPLNSQREGLVIDAGNADWAKATLDFYSKTPEELRVELADLGWTVEEFKKLPAYRLALASGNYPWLVLL